MKGVIITLVATAALIFLIIFAGGKAGEKKVERYTNMTSREVAVLCTTDMATAFHIHPEIYIKINGEDMPLPENIGIKPTCMNSIHTHDGGGIVHVEAPVQKDFTIGDFFAVWDKTFTKDQILDSRVDATHEIVVAVNGEPVDTFENTLLADKDKIVIEYKAK